jgi:hypothetical protein
MEVKKIIKDGRFADFEEFYSLKAQNDSLFDSLMPGDIVELACTSYSMGCDPSVDVALSTALWELDNEKNLIDSNNEWYERASRRPGDLEDGEWLVHCRNDGTLGSATDRTYHAID